MYGIQSTWLKPEAAGSSRTLLAAFAHPDDESFGPGGALAKYSAEGAAVHYACATRGEVGQASPKLLEGFTSLGDLRWHELECALHCLDLTGLHYLGYRDSGMPGSPDNAHPQALFQANFTRLVGQLVALIRWLHPQVVLTFDPYGGYGHPDHIAIHRATQAAFLAAGSPDQYPEQIEVGLEAYTPHKLYYTAFPKTILRMALIGIRVMGKDPTKFGRNQDINLTEIAAHEQAITTRLDIGRYLERKEQAANCHRSQSGPGGMFGWMPLPLRRMLMGRESFTRVHPPADRHTRENDLFSGVA
ncbi:MAG: PIG-L family deacetylase [Thermoflexales bacterium]|nr:PIG-L family deacetylase [Thermoflexales bacterium]